MVLTLKLTFVLKSLNVKTLNIIFHTAKKFFLLIYLTHKPDFYIQNPILIMTALFMNYKNK